MNTGILKTFLLEEKKCFLAEKNDMNFILIYWTEFSGLNLLNCP